MLSQLSFFEAAMESARNSKTEQAVKTALWAATRFEE
jgi:hypothetical protein